MSPEAEMDPAANLVGAGCAGYAEAVPDGAGSVAGMAQDPVATAASNNPLLTTLVAAVSGKLNPNVNLVDTLNGGEFTVFAPGRRRVREDRRRDDRDAQDRQRPADHDPDLPRGPRPDRSGRHRRHAHHGERR